MPAWVAPAIAAGSSLLGGLMGSKSAKAQQSAQNFQNEKMQREAWARDDSAIQRTVADAKAAGIHPLFAMGGTSGGGNTQFLDSTPSIYETGSTMGNVLSAAKDGYDAYRDQQEESRTASRNDRLADAQIKSAEARAKRDEAEALLAQSDVARATQAANQTRAGDKVTITALPHPTPLAKRPLVNHPRQSYPATVGGMGKNGPDVYRYANPDLGIEAVNDVIWLLNRAAESTEWTRGKILSGLMHIFGGK